MPSVLDNLQGSDQIPNQKYQPPTHVPTLFTWTAGWGGHICIAGSFDPPTPTWSPIEMPGNKVTLDLLPGKKYYYKFVIDGNWVTQPGQPTICDESGNENHEIQVELPPPPLPPPEEEKEEVNEEQPQEEVVVEDHNEEELKVVDNDHHKEHQHQDKPVVEKDQQHEESIVDENQQHEEPVVVEDQQHEEQVITDEHQRKEEQVEHQHQEEQVITEEQVMTDEHLHQEEQIISDEHKHQEQIVVDEHQHQEEQVITEEQVMTDEHQHQEEQVMADEHQHQEEQIIADEHQHKEEQVIADEHQHKEEQVMADEHQHQEQVIANEHQHQVVVDEHQEEQIVVDEHQHQEEQVEYHHQEESHHEEEDHHHHEDESTNVRIEEQHGDTVVSESTSEQKEETETKIISSETIEEITETKIINNETIGQNETFMSESSTIVKETIIGSDDKLSTEHVVNNIEETHDDSIATETNETLSTSQNDTEQTGEHTAKETVISSNSEAELSIDATSAIDSENKAESENVDDTHDLVPSKTIETHKLGFEYEDMNEEDDYDDGGDDENITTETTQGLNEATLKEVILNNTWAKDESYSYDENSLSQWTESHRPNPLVWPENIHLQWSDIHKSEQMTGSRSDGTTIVSEEIETSNKSEIEVEGNSEHTFKETFTTSNDESNLKEVQSNEIPSTTLSEKTIINQAESSLNNSFENTTVVESYMEHKTNESEQCEKPESSATADGTSVNEQHKHLSEEIVTSKTIDTSKATESLQENQSIPTGINVPRKIISISPNISSPGESTRNADLYTHNTNVATNMSRPSKEPMNTKSKHKKPVVEISTSREILKRDTRLNQQHGDELNKLDINLVYLVTSLATTFTLGIISMLYRSVFGTKK